MKILLCLSVQIIIPALLCCGYISVYLITKVEILYNAALAPPTSHLAVDGCIFDLMYTTGKNQSYKNIISIGIIHSVVIQASRGVEGGRGGTDMVY